MGVDLFEARPAQSGPPRKAVIDSCAVTAHRYGKGYDNDAVAPPTAAPELRSPDFVVTRSGRKLLGRNRLVLYLPRE